MSKIVLDNVASGYNLAKINNNFQKIETELNEKVLYRDVIDGEPNQLENDVDANGHSVYNLRPPTARGDAVTLGFIEDMAGGVLEVSSWQVETFTGDGSSDTFQIVYNPSSIESVFINIDGISLNPFTDFNLINGDKIVFNVVPYLNSEITIRYGTFLGAGNDSGISAIIPAPSSVGSVSVIKDQGGILKNLKSDNGTIDISEDANNIILRVGTQATDINLVSTGSGQSIVIPKEGTNLKVRSFIPGSGINLAVSDVPGSETISIINTNSPGEITTASNVGTGSGFYKTKSGADLQFKKLKIKTGLPTNRISLDDQADTVDIATSAELNTLASLGSGTSLVTAKSGEELRLKSIKGAGTVSISLDPSDVTNNTVLITGASGGTGTITGVQSVGATGTPLIVSDVVSGTAQVRKIATTFPLEITTPSTENKISLKGITGVGTANQVLAMDPTATNLTWVSSPNLLPLSNIWTGDQTYNYNSTGIDKPALEINSLQNGAFPTDVGNLLNSNYNSVINLRRTVGTAESNGGGGIVGLYNQLSHSGTTSSATTSFGIRSQVMTTCNQNNLGVTSDIVGVYSGVMQNGGSNMNSFGFHADIVHQPSSGASGCSIGGAIEFLGSITAGVGQTAGLAVRNYTSGSVGFGVLIGGNHNGAGKFRRGVSLGSPTYSTDIGGLPNTGQFKFDVGFDTTNATLTSGTALGLASGQHIRFSGAALTDLNAAEDLSACMKFDSGTGNIGGYNSGTFKWGFNQSTGIMYQNTQSLDLSGSTANLMSMNISGRNATGVAFTGSIRNWVQVSTEFGPYWIPLY